MVKKMWIIFLLGIMVVSLFSQRYRESDDFSYALKLYNEGFYDIAAQQFNLFVNRYSNSDRVPDAKYYQAMSLYNLKDFANARIEFQSLAVSFPDSKWAPESWYKVGECYLKLNKPDDAARSFETVKVLYPKDPNAPNALYQAARIYFAGSRFDRSESVLLDLLDRYLQSGIYLKARLLYANILIAEQKFNRAETELEKVLKSEASAEIQAQAHLGLGHLYRKLGQFERSEKEYLTALESKPEAATYFRSLSDLSELYAATRRYQEATGLINKNLPRLASTLYKQQLKLDLTAIHYLQGKYFAAEQTAASLPETMSNDTLSARRYFYLGEIYFAENKLDKSLKNFQKLLSDDSLRQAGKKFLPVAQKRIGNIYLKQNLFHQGYDHLTDYLKEYPEEPGADSVYIQLFQAALDDDQLPVAGQLYRDFVKTFPHHPQRDELLFQLAKYQFQAGDYNSSNSNFQVLLKAYYCSEKYDSTKEYLGIIRKYHGVEQQVGVNKLARLMGRFLAGEDVTNLQLELARIYLQQLKDFPESIRLCRTIVQETQDSTQLGEAYFLMAEGYRRMAEYEMFTGKNSSSEFSEAKNAFKKAMYYLRHVSYPDSLSFEFLETNLDSPAVDQKTGRTYRKFWQHFVDTYPESKFKNRARMILATLNLNEQDTAAAVTLLEQVSQEAKTGLRGDAFFRLAQIYRRQKKNDQAVSTLKTFLLNIPVHHLRAQAYALLAELQERRGIYDQAAESWKRLRQEYDYTGTAQTALDRMVGVYLLDARYQEVVVLTTPYLSEKTSADILLNKFYRPAKPRLYFYNGKARFLSGDLDEARLQLLKYLYSSTETLHRDESRYLLAEIALQKNDQQTALLHLGEIRRNENSAFFVQATRETADIYFNLGNFENALSLYTNIIPRTEDADQKMYFENQQMICLINLGRFKTYNAKLDAYRKTYKKHPQLQQNLARFVFEQGKYYYKHKKFDPAIKKFERVTKKYKTTDLVDDATYYLGLTYSTLNKTEKAQELLSRFIERYPRSSLLSNVYITLGGLYYRAEKREMSVEAFKKAVENAQDAETRKIALSNLIKTYQDLGLWDGILTQARAYVRAFPNAKDVIDKKILIGSALINLNRYTEAVDYLKKVKLEANSEAEPEIQFYIGEAYFNAGQYENAIREFVKIPLLSRQTKLQWEASALYFSGQSYEKMGRIDDAIRMYQEIINRPGIMVDLKREARKRIDQLKKGG